MSQMRPSVDNLRHALRWRRHRQPSSHWPRGWQACRRGRHRCCCCSCCFTCCCSILCQRTSAVPSERVRSSPRPLSGSLTSSALREKPRWRSPSWTSTAAPLCPTQRTTGPSSSRAASLGCAAALQPHPSRPAATTPPGVANRPRRCRAAAEPPPRSHSPLLQLLGSPISKLAGVARETFLPVGYPGSVADEYITYQLWDTVQAMCSYLRGVLCTQALLEGIGVRPHFSTHPS